ncbi:hypothetical protein [uncultured Methanobrevibacter sp.]|uniref:hypothetical protein n=1 Tax=uncultured Methanobrevibacter sp. TaxID=253161 RepID=UPI0025F1CFA2|nr:hypothetical protein [uncultured Methanobrevibacter sp.]
MTDLLMDTIKAKRNLIQCYGDLSDAVDEFDEKWEEKGVDICTCVDWKTKTILYLNVHDRIPDEIQDILADFKDTFNVELTEIKEEKALQTTSRCKPWVTWTYVFQHVDRYAFLKGGLE